MKTIERKIYDISPETFKVIGYFNKLNKLRVKALSARNPVKYYNLCEELGIEPEDKDLYQLGIAELQYSKNN